MYTHPHDCDIAVDEWPNVCNIAVDNIHHLKAQMWDTVLICTDNFVFSFDLWTCGYPFEMHVSLLKLIQNFPLCQYFFTRYAAPSRYNTNDNPV